MYEQYLPVVSVALAKSITCVPVEPAYCEPSMLLVPHAEWKTIVLAYVFTQPYPVALPLRALESWNEPQPPEAPSGGIRTIEPDVSSTNMTLGTPPEFTKKSVSSPPGGLITASPKLDASREHDVVSAWRTAGRARSNATSASWRRDMIPLLQRELDGDLDFELAAGAVDAVGEPALNVTELVRAAGAIGAVLLAQRAVVGRLGERDVVQDEVAGVLRTVVPRHGGEPAGQVHRRARGRGGRWPWSASSRVAHPPYRHVAQRHGGFDVEAIEWARVEPAGELRHVVQGGEWGHVGPVRARRRRAHHHPHPDRPDIGLMVGEPRRSGRRSDRVRVPAHDVVDGLRTRWRGGAREDERRHPVTRGARGGRLGGGERHRRSEAAGLEVGVRQHVGELQELHSLGDEDLVGLVDVAVAVRVGACIEHQERDLRAAGNDRPDVEAVAVHEEHAGRAGGRGEAGIDREVLPLHRVRRDDRVERVRQIAHGPQRRLRLVHGEVRVLRSALADRLQDLPSSQAVAGPAVERDRGVRDRLQPPGVARRIGRVDARGPVARVSRVEDDLIVVLGRVTRAGVQLRRTGALVASHVEGERSVEAVTRDLQRLLHREERRAGRVLRRALPVAFIGRALLSDGDAEDAHQHHGGDGDGHEELDQGDAGGSGIAHGVHWLDSAWLTTNEGSTSCAKTITSPARVPGCCHTTDTDTTLTV